MKTAIALRATLAAGLLAAGAAGSPNRVIVLPIENLSGARDVARDLRPDLLRRVARAGFSIVTDDALEPELEKERVRYLDSVSSEVRRRLMRDLDAAGMLSIGVDAYVDGSNPLVALSARLVDSDGRLVWSNAVGKSAADTEGLFGTGRASTRVEVARAVLDALLAGLPGPGKSASPRSAAARRPGLSGPRTWVSGLLPRKSVVRVCILPFSNFTPVRSAPRVVGELLALRLSESRRFDVVEPADFREALREENLPAVRNWAPATLQALARRLGTDFFLRGTVYEYREAAPQNATSRPTAELALELFDVSRGKVLWTGYHARNGADYQGMLQFGAVSNLSSLVDRMLGEVVAAQGRASPARSEGRESP